MRRETYERLTRELREAVDNRETGVKDPDREAHSEAEALALEIGSLKTQFHDLTYFKTLYEHRYNALCRECWGEPNPCGTPPSEIPDDLLSVFTVDGRIPVEMTYSDATRPDNYPLIYADPEVDCYLDRIRRKEYFLYGQTDLWLYEALEKYGIRGLSVAVMGSMTPWYESVCLHFGGLPTTIEYNTIITKSERLKAMTVAEWEEQRTAFDCAVSISSFEHDGLGQYGDPVDPTADLKAMRKMKEVVKPGGIMFLALPVGRDRLMFNVARVYGAIRLPMLLEGWTVVDRFGYQEGILETNGSIQPVFVLRND